MNIQRLISLLLCLLLVLSMLPSCGTSDTTTPANVDPASPQAKSYYDFFDTVTVIFSYKNDTAEEFANNCQAVSALLQEYHRLFDIYYEYAGINNLKTVNDNAGKEPVAVDDKLIDFLLYTKEVYTLTGGMTNVAMGSVLKLWHDERENGIDDPESASLPDGAKLSAAAQHTDINQLIIDKEAGTVYLADPAMRLDVGAIAKGYATEKAAQLLIARGVTSYVLNVGGNIRTIGTKPSGNGWVTGITNPDKTSEKSFVCKVDIKNISLVTSGDYERYYLVDGVPYHHIIDPKTNMPANYFSSISVFCIDGGLADALSTALFCMTYEEGLKLVNSIGGVDVIWVDKSGTLLKTNGISLYDN